MTDLHGLTEVREVTEGTPGAIQSSIDGVWRVFVPVSAIITPLVEVNASERYMTCFRENKTTLQKFDAWRSEYVCECGERNVYIIVRKGV